MSTMSMLSFEAPVDEVILMEDRAHVIRRGSIELPVGSVRLVVQDVAPVMGDKTLTAAIEAHPEGADGAAVALVRVKRIWRSEDERPQDAAARIEQQQRALDEERAAASARQARLERERALRAELLTMTTREHLEEVAWGRFEEESFREEFQGQRGSLRALEDQLAAIEEELEDLERQRKELRVAAVAHQGIDRRKAARLEAEWVVPVAGRYRIRFDYVVPGALWRPIHRATLTDSGVRFEMEGCAWQRTGEDWRDVQLSFSTERPSLGTQPPRLSPDGLRVQRKQELVVEAREQEVHTAGLGGGGASGGMMGIDDGGEVRLLKGLERVTVPADGLPCRVPVGAFTAAVQEELVCYPELAAVVLRRTELVNEAQQPILAGPVDLIRAGGHIGRTTVLYIAPGERFELGWGPEPDLRVHRELAHEDEESHMLSSWRTRQRTIKLKLSNLGHAAHQLTVTERVPVSELDKVQIRFDAEGTTDGRSPDENGFVRFPLTVPGSDHEELVLRYTVRRHSDVKGLSL